MPLPTQQPADDATQVFEQVFHDGTTRSARVSNREFPFPRGRVLISRTDLNGIITHANEAFIELSGYSWDELVGQPHHILRHPDMPKAAYEDLWNTVQAHKKWFGYVKNLRKDGLHYWVYATAVPNRRYGEVVGYTSVRREMSRRKIDEMTATYRDLMAATAEVS